MKLLVFAHTPPPHHGQSQMIAHLVTGFGGDVRTRPKSAPSSPHSIEVFHVNARLSDDLEDVGAARWGKVFVLIRYCFQALWIRFRHGVHSFYYVPSPPKRASLYRDWIVMLLCRPFFKRIILHWHSVGLGEWLETKARPWERRVTHWLLGRPDLNLVLSRYNEPDANRLNPKRSAIVPNGIPDPCDALFTAKKVTSSPSDLATQPPIHVLFMALCTRDKGVHDAVQGVTLANAMAAAASNPQRFELQVAGAFVDRQEREDFDALCDAPEIRGRVQYLGFLDATAKATALKHADLFCFPTYYANEGQPLNLLEALAYGIPAVATRWRAIPELFDEAYPGLIEPKHPEHVAEALLRIAGMNDRVALRKRFLERYTVEKHLAVLAMALCSVDPDRSTDG